MEKCVLTCNALLEKKMQNCVIDRDPLCRLQVLRRDPLPFSYVSDGEIRQLNAIGMKRSGLVNQQQIGEVRWWYKYKYDPMKKTLTEQLERKADGTEYWFRGDFERFDAWRAILGDRARRRMVMKLPDY